MCKYLVSSGQSKEDDIEEGLSYAELWVGTHTKSPSHLKDGTALSEYIKKHSEVLGNQIIDSFGESLPFLLKVLSIGHPLQLQIHPTKVEAKELYKKNPKAFLDENHKPEMAVALTPFTAMCGFREPAEILMFATEIEELAEALGPLAVKVLHSDVKSDDKIKACYDAIFKTRKNFLELQSKLANRFLFDKNLYDEYQGNVFQQLFNAFPGRSSQIKILFILSCLIRRPRLLCSFLTECFQACPRGSYMGSCWRNTCLCCWRLY